jgi:hypothetical protein
MYARAVEDFEARLVELRREEWEDLGLAASALALALVATQIRPTLALPLFLGGLGVGVLGIRAFGRRWALVERLASQRDAYVIPEVLAFAAQEATYGRRQSLAAVLRGWTAPGSRLQARAFVVDLEALASDLDDESLELDPACAVACVRLLSDRSSSPLLNPSVPPDQLRSTVVQIRSGFAPRRAAA